MNKQQLKRIIKEELTQALSEAEKAPRQTPAQQEYDALNVMLTRLAGMEAFLLSTTRMKSDEDLTQLAAEQIGALEKTLKQLRIKTQKG